MTELAKLESEYEYTIEFDDGSEFIHLYFANVIDTENPSVLRFEPQYELGKELERKVSGETVMIPYSRVLRIIKRTEPD